MSTTLSCDSLSGKTVRSYWKRIACKPAFIPVRPVAAYLVVDSRGFTDVSVERGRPYSCAVQKHHHHDSRRPLSIHHLQITIQKQYKCATGVFVTSNFSRTNALLRLIRAQWSIKCGSPGRSPTSMKYFIFSLI